MIMFIKGSETSNDMPNNVNKRNVCCDCAYKFLIRIKILKY